MPFPLLSPFPSAPLQRRDDSTSTTTNADALFDPPSALVDFHSKVGYEGSLECTDGEVLDSRDGGYKTNGEGEDGTHYCGDKKESPSYIWWESNMDIDCDGAPSATGICVSDGSYQSQTAFTDDSGNPIDASTVQYVVIDQDDNFDPTSFGVQPLSVVAVVCGKGGKMTFGVWADTNAIGSMGEASVTFGRVCFGEVINGNSGHGPADVLYIAFPGSEADTVPSSLGSDEDKLFTLGQKLVAGVFGDSGGGSSSSSSGGETETSGSKTSGGGEPTGGKSATSPTSTASATQTSEPSSSSAFGTTSSTPASSSSSTSSPSTTSTTGSTLSFSSLSPTTLLAILAVVLLLSGLIAWLCVSSHGQHGSRECESDTSSSGSSETDVASSDESSGRSSDSEEEDEKWLCSGRRRKKRWDD
ncbi:hypothetical protein JCM10207_006183 [Rhodosporidiobolus poonsookiae]